MFDCCNADGLIRQSANATTNEVIAFYKYAPFGLEQGGSHSNGGGSNNRYRYNGKELDEATGQYFYGFRMYDPAIARFTGVDPIADKFAWVSVYNYAENEPVRHIDLHGLQKALPSEVVNLGKRIESTVQGFFSSAKPSAETSRRTNLALSGSKNFALGVIGTAAAISFVPESGGFSAMAIPLTIGEAGVGLAQIADAITGEADPNAVLHSVESLPGLAAGELGVEGDALKLIDGGSQVITMALGSPGGNILKGLSGDFADAAGAFGKGKVLTGTSKGMSAHDGVGDIQSTLEAANSLLNSGNSSTSRQAVQDNTTLNRILLPRPAGLTPIKN